MVVVASELTPALSTEVRTVVSVRSCDTGIQGPENLILTLAEAFAARGLRYVIVNLWDGQPPRVELHDEAVRRGFESYIVAGSWGLDPGLLRHLRRAFVRLRPDVVLTHDVKSEVTSLLCTRGQHVPLVGFYYGRLALNSLWLKLGDLSSFASFRFFDRVLANSTAQASELRRWGFSSSNVHLVPSFVNAATIRPASEQERCAARAKLGISPGQPVLATIARLSPNKGQRYMLQALRAVSERFPDVLYLLPGEGDTAWHGEGGYRARLEQEADALGVASSVRFLGYYPDLKTILAATDLLVSPSLREGMQVSLLEAMAAGLPIVATRVGGTPDAVVDGLTGLLVPPADARALSDAVVGLLADGARRQSFGVAARQLVIERFDASVVAESVLRHCREVVARRVSVRRPGLARC